MPLYHELNPEIVADLLSRTEGFHGTDLYTIWRIHYPGRPVDNYDLECILDELEVGGQIQHKEKPTPTPSQAAFLGLQFRKHPGWAPGTKLGFWYEVGARGTHENSPSKALKSPEG